MSTTTTLSLVEGDAFLDVNLLNTEEMYYAESNTYVHYDVLIVVGFKKERCEVTYTS